MGAMQRNKGKRAEREVIELLQPVVTAVYTDAGFHADDIPKLKRNTMQSDGGGFDIHGLEWCALEVKHQEAFSRPSWWRQACEQATSTQTPVLFYRRNKTKFKVWWRADDGEVVVDASIAEFLAYFERRLQEALSPG